MVAIRISSLGRIIYAAAAAAVGVLLLARKFEYVWVPLPRWLAGREVLALAAGALMLVAAAGLAWRRTVARSSAILAFFFLSWLLLLQVPAIVAAPSEESLWAGGGQLITVLVGGWLLFDSSSPATEGPWRRMRGERGTRMARWLYAVALVPIGLHHFFADAGAVEAVPAWLPFRAGWAYGTGIAHIAAGVAIVLGIVPRLAATLEAIMIASFIVLLHVPWVVGAPRDPLQWAMLFVALLIDGGAWIVAGSYGVNGRRGLLEVAPGLAPWRSR
jgi:uncharacterized membrane protein YphA (DoxX/SURF4 family)